MFTKQELHLLNSVTEEFSKRANHSKIWNFENFMGEFYLFINEIEKGYTLTIDDYTNDLSKRDLVEVLLGKLPPSLKIKVSQLIETWDKRYDQATNIIQEPLIGENQPWWWYRIPKILTGELKEDVESLDIK